MHHVGDRHITAPMTSAILRMGCRNRLIGQSTSVDRIAIRHRRPNAPFRSAHQHQGCTPMSDPVRRIRGPDELLEAAYGWVREANWPAYDQDNPIAGGVYESGSRPPMPHPVA